jgi:hypothetical protein
MQIAMTVLDLVKTISIIIGALSVIGSFIGLFVKVGKVLKTIESVSQDTKEIKSTLDIHGNRLTAIETTLRLAEWFGHSHEREKVGH